MRQGESQVNKNPQFNSYGRGQSSGESDANLANIRDLAQRVSEVTRSSSSVDYDKLYSYKKAKPEGEESEHQTDAELYTVLRNKYGLESKVRIDDRGAAWLLTEQGEELFADLEAVKKHLGI